MPWRDEQLPVGDDIFLDHIGFFVSDIEAVGPRFERLGFTVHPTSIHYNEAPDGTLVRSGTANRLVTFDRGYIEVLAAVADTPLADQLQTSLARYEGIHLIALSHADVASQDPRIAREGFAMQPTVELRRNLDTANGPQQVRATVARCQPGVMPEGRAQMLTHGTPDLIWLSEYSQHPNAITTLIELLVVSDEPAEAANRYAKFTDATPLPPGDGSLGVHTVELPRGRLTFVSSDNAMQFLPNLDVPSFPYSGALVLGSADLARTRGAIRDGGVVPIREASDLIVVGPGDGIGAYIVIVSDKTPEKTVWSRLSDG